MVFFGFVFNLVHLKEEIKIQGKKSLILCIQETKDLKFEKQKHI